MYYNFDNSPILDVLEWSRKFENTPERIVGRTHWLFGHLTISTVWMGIDHDFGWYIRNGSETPNPHPLQFETMVFVFGRDICQYRWRSLTEAQAGHKAVRRAILRHPIKFLRGYPDLEL